MESLYFLLVGLAIVAVVVWGIKSKGRHHRTARTSSKREFNDLERTVIDSAQRLVDVINESLKIANDSKNVDTKISRLDVAKQMLGRLKQLSTDHPFIELAQLPQVEQSIAELEREFIQAGYREAAEGNMRGQSLEKEGKLDEAILAYERLLEKGVDTPFTYRRLAIIYSKHKQRDDELRVLRAAIKNVPVENSNHYQWFAERLAKKS
jgi:tetratricopeptide (TPR) repeat protein